jgi:hypothetical protein
MTGDYGTAAYQGYLRNDSVTIAEVLRLTGYRTLMSGNPTPRKRGFDRFFGTIDGAGSFFTPHHLMEDDSRMEVADDDFYMTGVVTIKAVRMITEAVTMPQPFFLYLAYPADFDGHGIQSLDGESMGPLFAGSGGERQSSIYWEHEGNCAVRQGDWKLVREYGQEQNPNMGGHEETK